MKAINRARAERKKLFPDKQWADLRHIDCAKMSNHYEEARREDKQKVIKAINKRIIMAKAIIAEDKKGLKTKKNDDAVLKILKMEIVVNMNIIGDYELLLKAIDKIYGGSDGK